MDKFDEMMTELKKLKVIQHYYEPEEDIPEEIFNKYFNDYKLVAQVNHDKHRHYELCTFVYKIHGRFLGINAICTMYSEGSCIRDVYHELSFEEMKEVTTTTYV